MTRADSTAFAGKTVVITGGSRGIGYATAQAFLAQGARVAICALDAARLAAAEQALSERGEVFALRADVADYGALEAFFAQVQSRFGPVEVLVNNAGVVWAGAFATQPREALDAVVDVNVRGVLYATRLALPVMLARRRGVIVNVASGAGLAGFAHLAVYCSSKFAVVGFTAALAEELRDSHVRVHALCPGRVATDMQVQYCGRRIGMPPERIAEAILRLAGEHPPVAPGRCLEL